MAKLNVVCLKTVRITAWPLLALMILYLITGYVLCGQTTLSRWIAVETAVNVHKAFDVPLVVLFVAHSLPAIYLAFWRWGWIGKKNKVL
jgi:cytochrome b subunit of formate dehydrogenase